MQSAPVTLTWPSTPMQGSGLLHQQPQNDAWSYTLDWWQRSILFLDTLRERADNMLAHEQAGLPPPLNFSYDIILDARQFDRPTNYALVKIVDPDIDHLKDHLKDRIQEPLAPVIVVDPRAGHGPGIGGFKRDSEVGMALQLGHPVYFVIFFPDPFPDQTLADVHHALRRFVEEVSRRHSTAPVLYGNCQAGWAVTLLSADCAGLVGPAVLNGSPLSYWAGASDVNPMRLAGGLMGGAWLVDYLADLNNGEFDGAWLVQNFESLKPGHALWDKYIKLFSDVDSERERFLEFERWWGGFYFLSRNEIVNIVENLFIGNQLEQGTFRICEGCFADLKRIRNPLVIFASSGDNITPPHQALNWIPAIYPTTAQLQEAGQRIVYLLNTHVGHLGIFASADVARFEHRAILENLHRLEDLPAGLYEMKIARPVSELNDLTTPYTVSFEERKVEDIHFDYPRSEFENVERLSEWNEALYEKFAGPWIRAAANPVSSFWLKWMHPMRISRYAFSEKVMPWMAMVRVLAHQVEQHRQPVDDHNPYREVEKTMNQQISNTFESYEKLRDTGYEWMFQALY